MRARTATTRRLQPGWNSAGTWPRSLPAPCRRALPLAPEHSCRPPLSFPAVYPRPAIGRSLVDLFDGCNFLRLSGEPSDEVVDRPRTLSRANHAPSIGKQVQLNLLPRLDPQVLHHF